MDWNALVIGLSSGLVGGVLGAAMGIVAVLMRAETEVDREVREARRQYRREQSQALREFLKEVEQYHGSIFLQHQIQFPPTASPIPIEQHPPLPLQELERDLFGSIPLNLLLGQTLMPSLSA